jgi:hypothetical protein
VKLLYPVTTLYSITTQKSSTWNIKMDVRETGWEGVDWMHLVEGRDQWWALVNTVKGRGFLD